MSTLTSPGINVVEKDYSAIVPNVSSSVGAMVGRFTKGPVEIPILINSETQLHDIFGGPDDVNANEWFTIAEFLKYTSSCYVVRSKTSSITSANAGGSASINVWNRDLYEAGVPFTGGGAWLAKNPGDEGNGISVIMVDFSTWAAFKTWCDTNVDKFPMKKQLYKYFNGQPNTSNYVYTRCEAETAKYDEFHILVIDTLGKVTGTRYSILEKFEGVSKAKDALSFDGSSLYYRNVVNETSRHIWWNAAPTGVTTGVNIVAIDSSAFEVTPTGKTFSMLSAFYNVTLSGGLKGTTYSLSDITSAYDKLSDKNLYSIDLVMCGAFGAGLSPAIATAEVESYVLDNIVSARKDCVAFCSPHTNGSPIRDGVSATTTITSFVNSLTTPDADKSYGFMDSGMKYIFDRYNKVYRYVPLNGDMAGLAARTDNTNDAWWSFAGFNRGGVKNVIKLAYNPSEAARDSLYPIGVNSVIIDPSAGPTLLGDRTLTQKPSAFDRINVRRLFILIERAIAKAVRYQLFEFNDNFTRSQFKNMVQPYLQTIKGRRGITDFFVKCDETNNTGEIIDKNEFVADIYIKPARSINFITLNFVATRTDISFNTIVEAS